MTIDRIDVICKDPRHARGKVAKIDTFTRLPGGWVAESRRHGWRALPDEYHGGSRHFYRCKLCGLCLNCTTPTLQWALDAIASQGVSEASLKALNLLVSK